MPDREKALRLLNQAIDTAFGANCELVKLPVTVAIEIEELLREQKKEQKRIVSWLGKFCSHVDQHFQPLPDEQNIEFFRQKMKQLFGWDVRGDA